MASSDFFNSPNFQNKFDQNVPGDNKLSDSYILEDDNDRKPGPVHQFQLVTPRTITGPANMSNKGAIDWFVTINLFKKDINLVWFYY